MNEEMIVRLSIEGTVLLFRGAKEIVSLLVALLKYSKSQTQGEKVQNFLRETSAPGFLTMTNADAELFKKAAKPFGLHYVHIKQESNPNNSLVMFREEDRAIVNRILERENIGVLDRQQIEEISKEPDAAAEKDEKVRLEDAVEESRETSEVLIRGSKQENPTQARMGEDPSVQDSLNIVRELADVQDRRAFDDHRPLSNDELQEIRETTEKSVEQDWNPLKSHRVYSSAELREIDESIKKSVDYYMRQKYKITDHTDPIVGARPALPKPSLHGELAKKTAQVQLSKKERLQRAADLSREGKTPVPVPGAGQR